MTFQCSSSATKTKGVEELLLQDMDGVFLRVPVFKGGYLEHHWLQEVEFQLQPWCQVHQGHHQPEIVRKGRVFL